MGSLGGRHRADDEQPDQPVGAHPREAALDALARDATLDAVDAIEAALDAFTLGARDVRDARAALDAESLEDYSIDELMPSDGVVPAGPPMAAPGPSSGSSSAPHSAPPSAPPSARPARLARWPAQDRFVGETPSVSPPTSTDLPVRVPGAIRDLTVTAEMEPIRDEPPTGRARLARPALIVASVVILGLAVLAVGRALVPGNTATGAPVQLAATPPGPPLPSSVDSAGTQAPAVPTTASTSRASSTTRSTSAAGGAGVGMTTPTRTTDERLAVGAEGFTAAYSVDQRWPGGFIARVAITNSGATAQPWQLTITYPPTVAGFVASWSNASVQPHTDATAHSAIIAGAAPLGAGQSIGVFVQFIAMGENIAPTECSVNTIPCSQT